MTWTTRCGPQSSLKSLNPFGPPCHCPPGNEKPSKLLSPLIDVGGPVCRKPSGTRGDAHAQVHDLHVTASRHRLRYCHCCWPHPRYLALPRVCALQLLHAAGLMAAVKIRQRSDLRAWASFELTSSRN